MKLRIQLLRLRLSGSLPSFPRVERSPPWGRPAVDRVVTSRMVCAEELVAMAQAGSSSQLDNLEAPLAG
jgi:hypothetical protein